MPLSRDFQPSELETSSAVSPCNAPSSVEANQKLKPVVRFVDLVLLGNGAKLQRRGETVSINNNANIFKRGKNKILLITLLFGVNDGGGLPLLPANINISYQQMVKTAHTDGLVAWLGVARFCGARAEAEREIKVPLIIRVAIP